MLIVAPKELIGLWFSTIVGRRWVVEKYPLTPTIGRVQASRCQEFHMQTLDVFR